LKKLVMNNYDIVGWLDLEATVRNHSWRLVTLLPLLPKFINGWGWFPE